MRDVLIIAILLLMLIAAAMTTYYVYRTTSVVEKIIPASAPDQDNLNTSMIEEVKLYSTTPVNYYLVKGYKITADMQACGCGFSWNGYAVFTRSIFGIETSEYKILVIGLGAGNPFVCWSGFAVVKESGGHQEGLASYQAEPDKWYKVTIVYDYDGYIKININDKLVYSFVATTDKYMVVVGGDTSYVKVHPPEQLPAPDDNDNTIGRGPNPPSIKELQLKYIAIGAGVLIIAVVATYFVVKGIKRR